MQNTQQKHIMVKNFENGFYIVREDRENHPGREKACLYYGTCKMAACKEGKIQLKTPTRPPDKYLEALKDEWEKIASEEADAGLTTE